MRLVCPGDSRTACGWEAGLCWDSDTYSSLWHSRLLSLREAGVLMWHFAKKSWANSAYPQRSRGYQTTLLLPHIGNSLRLPLWLFSCNSKVSIEISQEIKQLSNGHLLLVVHRPPWASSCSCAPSNLFFSFSSSYPSCCFSITVVIVIVAIIIVVPIPSPISELFFFPCGEKTFCYVFLRWDSRWQLRKLSRP